ncbi:MAG: permease [Clostridia bacterium]|nr:permease [Clostridia bacterium]
MDTIISFLMSNQVVTIFVVALLGYLLGSIKIAGLQLGTSGILLVALVFGHFGIEVPKIVQDFGLAAFVTSVGLIAGPTFFRNFKSKALSYVILGFVIIILGALTCVLSIVVFKIPTDLSAGMMSGALTSTPGLAAAIESTGGEASMASVGYGIAYPFGVIGVVLFVQLMPKILRVDIKKEAALLEKQLETKTASADKNGKKPFTFDSFGFTTFALAVFLGVLIGKIVIPLPGGASFSLGTSGGPLLVGLIIGHFGKVGNVSLTPPTTTLKVMRELGLALFLLGAGMSAGKGFIAVLAERGVALFLIGAAMTLIPMIVGYFLARKVFKLDIVNTLGCICGGMTSTPALGTLISVTDSDSVASAYAATYPISLVFVVIASQFLGLLFG